MKIAIRDWTFTHWWVRPVVKTWFNIYHKTVTYSGTENIDWQRPIIFAPSHRNAFSDALCLILPTAYTPKKFIYPLIRADAFGKNRFLDWLLTSFHMMPVYRPRDQVNLRRQNETVFGQCYDILNQKRNLLIHPEGNCIPRKKVRRFKKGLARIALGAEAKRDFNLGVVVIPVGINYREITEARQGIHIRYGNPVAVADFKEVYRNHTASAIKQLTQKVQKRVEKLTINIQSDDAELICEELFKLYRNSAASHLELNTYSKKELQVKQQIVQSIQHQNSQNASIDGIGQKITSLQSELQQHQLSAAEVLVHDQSPFRLFLEGIVYIILLPFALYGWINNIIPWAIIHRIADNVKELQFRSSARMTLGLLLFPLAYLLQTILVFVISESWQGSLLYLILLPFTGLLALNWWERCRILRQKVKISLLPKNMHNKICRSLNEIFSTLISNHTS